MRQVVSDLGLRSALLTRSGFRHAFFMRTGGVSRPPYATLNFSTAGGDLESAVAENLRRAAAELEVAPERVYYLSQVHGVDVHVLDGFEDREEVLLAPGDVTVSAARDVACAVRMADCAAVLVGDPHSGAVAAIHSGWRGTVQGAVRAGVSALRQEVGDAPFVAAVGPHIELCCFEVGDDVAEQLADASPLGAQVVDDSRNKPHVDLRRIIEAQLADAGVREVEHVVGCTMCDTTRFHSYRRDGPRSGRMLAAIVAKGP